VLTSRFANRQHIAPHAVSILLAPTCNKDWFF
jgi:hypothetical protein